MRRLNDGLKYRTMTTRKQLIKQAQIDPADEGTEWMERTDKWLRLLHDDAAND